MINLFSDLKHNAYFTIQYVEMLLLYNLNVIAIYLVNAFVTSVEQIKKIVKFFESSLRGMWI